MQNIQAKSTIYSYSGGNQDFNPNTDDSATDYPVLVLTLNINQSYLFVVIIKIDHEPFS